MGRIASLLDEVKATFLSNELQQIKDELIESLKNSNAESSDKDELSNKITRYFSIHQQFSLLNIFLFFSYSSRSPSSSNFLYNLFQ